MPDTNLKVPLCNPELHGRVKKGCMQTSRHCGKHFRPFSIAKIRYVMYPGLYFGILLTVLMNSYARPIVAGPSLCITVVHVHADIDCCMISLWVQGSAKWANDSTLPHVPGMQSNWLTYFVMKSFDLSLYESIGFTWFRTFSKCSSWTQSQAQHGPFKTISLPHPCPSTATSTTFVYVI